MLKLALTRKEEDPAAPEQHMAFGEVYAPDRPDAQGEFMRADEIRKMAYEFAKNGRLQSIDVMHDNNVEPGRAYIVESFIARKGDPDFIEGAWVIGMYIPDDQLWDSVKKGEINGFSMEALVTRHEQETEIHMPPVVTGRTSKSGAGDVAPHEHRFFVSYDGDGKFRGGVTDSDLGHSHQILAGTHTETTMGHSHRFSSVDDMKIAE